jgi:glutaredoxin
MTTDSSNNDNKIVTVYSTSWCAFCHTEMQWLDKLGIPYEAKDIEADKSAYDELLEKIGGDFRGVPVTDISGDIVLGFDRPKIQEALAKHDIQPAAA